MSGKLELAVTQRQRAFLDASCGGVLLGCGVAPEQSGPFEITITVVEQGERS